MNIFCNSGCIRVFIRNRQWLEIANSLGMKAYIEFPSEWHEDRLGTVVIHLGWPALYISFPWGRVYPDHGQCSGPRFGFHFFGDLLWIYHGNDTGSSEDKSKTTIYMPWRWKRCQHEVLDCNGNWVPFVGSWENKPPDGRNLEEHDYTYILENGKKQHRKATIYVERRIYTRRWWFPRRKEHVGIDVSFNDEVGEETGSWKGGTMGCGYTLKEGETPLQCLRRMENERPFT